jgi:hypothetical protein
MPIRFRCAYCNQLMGIARRKAGTVVRCPTCAGQVIVPNPEPGDEEAAAGPEPPEPPAGAAPPAKPDLFERSNFGEELFHEDRPDTGLTAGRHPELKPAPPPVNAPPPPRMEARDIEPFSPRAPTALNGPPPAPPGIFLTPVKVTILAVFVVLLIGVAFFAGMLVGRS